MTFTGRARSSRRCWSTCSTSGSPRWCSRAAPWARATCRAWRRRRRHGRRGEVYYPACACPRRRRWQGGAQADPALRCGRQRADQHQCLRDRAGRAPGGRCAQALEWADLAYAMDLNGMNLASRRSASRCRSDRPYPWLNCDAARRLDMIKGSYLFDKDQAHHPGPGEPARLVDPPGLGWEAWASWQRRGVPDQLLRPQPAIRVGLSPRIPGSSHTPDDAILRQGRPAPPRPARLHRLERQLGPYPLANDVEAFTIALANLDIAVMLRFYKFS